MEDDNVTLDDMRIKPVKGSVKLFSDQGKKTQSTELSNRTLFICLIIGIITLSLLSMHECSDKHFNYEKDNIYRG